ncbi:hypothetical protein DPMN_141510 [Dreissena polymorpha]|uniref:Uncharacterized protein n=1 Tax=Dreissena polymorpha TaxID=45954 RepID=A0A9D4G9I3_DREPO|nr:hypothetical protein DPMN_175212 [Dreissena polymorpha]KAH3813061.1 hypothetical protein DPMN_141510 [Dreissena polymorpha]
MFSALSIKGADRKRAVGKLSLAAERASSWLWKKREELETYHQHVVSDQHCGPAAWRVSCD